MATLAVESVTVRSTVPPLWLQLIATVGFRSMPLLALRAMTNTGGRVLRDAVKACAIHKDPRFSDHAPYVVDYALDNGPAKGGKR